MGVKHGQWHWFTFWGWGNGFDTKGPPLKHVKWNLLFECEGMNSPVEIPLTPDPWLISSSRPQKLSIPVINIIGGKHFSFGTPAGLLFIIFTNICTTSHQSEEHYHVLKKKSYLNQSRVGGGSPDTLHPKERRPTGGREIKTIFAVNVVVIIFVINISTKVMSCRST